MKKGWTEVALGEILTPVARFEERNELKTYQFAGTYSYARGIFKGNLKPGSSFNLPRIQKIKTGDFIYCKIMAWEGAFGLAGTNVDGNWMSGAFVAYQPDVDHILPKYLSYWFRTESNWKRVAAGSTGTNVRRKSLHPQDFVKFRLKLPPLAEQQRIVAHLDAIEQHLKRIQKLREESEKENIALTTGLTHRWDLSNEQKLNKGWIPTNLGEVMQKTSDSVSVDPTSNYCNFGILSYAKGTFKKPAINGSTSSAPALYRVRKGQFIYSRLFAFEGAYALVAEELDGFFVSNEFPSFDIDQKRLLPEFIFSYFKSHSIWEALASQAVGLGNRRQRIHPEIILKHKIFLPPIEYQEMVRDTLYNLEKAQCNSIEPEHSALLPSLLDSIFNS